MKKSAGQFWRTTSHEPRTVSECHREPDVSDDKDTYRVVEYDSIETFNKEMNVHALAGWRVHSFHRRDYYYDGGAWRGYRTTFTVLLERVP